MDLNLERLDFCDYSPKCRVSGYLLCCHHPQLFCYGWNGPLNSLTMYIDRGLVVYIFDSRGKSCEVERVEERMLEERVVGEVGHQKRSILKNNEA